MALEFIQKDANFDLTPGEKQRLENLSVTFSRPVRTAECSIKGFNIRYGSGDHPLRELEIDIDGPRINPNNRAEVKFDVDFGLRDSTGYYDDAYKGWVQVLVIADTQ